MNDHRGIYLTLFFSFLFFSVYAQDSRIFWVEKSSGKIQSATLQGTNITDIATGLQLPECVAIDTTSSPKKLYCTEAGASRIIRMNFDGSNLEEVVTGISGLADLELDMVNRKV